MNIPLIALATGIVLTLIIVAALWYYFKFHYISPQSKLRIAEMFRSFGLTEQANAHHFCKKYVDGEEHFYGCNKDGRIIGNKQNFVKFH
jgi:hypothetical protein